MDDLPPGPGFHELDTITHCSHTTKGEYLRTLTTTDPVTGSTLIHAIRNNTHINIKAGMDWIRQHSPAPIPGMDFDNEPRPLNKLHSLVMKRKNFLLPCVKATTWNHTNAGHKKHVYDTPTTSYQRLLNTSALNQTTTQLPAAEHNPAARAQGTRPTA